ncbi:unnamed protein product, partial [Amoebophrya sp. A120]|eukprot:GSA120T00009344001.1
MYYRRPNSPLPLWRMKKVIDCIVIVLFHICCDEDGHQRLLERSYDSRTSTSQLSLRSSFFGRRAAKLFVAAQQTSSSTNDTLNSTTTPINQTASSTPAGASGSFSSSEPQSCAVTSVFDQVLYNGEAMFEILQGTIRFPPLKAQRVYISDSDREKNSIAEQTVLPYRNPLRQQNRRTATPGGVRSATVVDVMEPTAASSSGEEVLSSLNPAPNDRGRTSAADDLALGFLN